MTKLISGLLSHQPHLTSDSSTILKALTSVTRSPGALVSRWADSDSPLGQWKLSRSKTMAPPSGSAAYKKKDGTLTISQDRESVSWIPAAGGASGSVKLSVAHITSTSIAIRRSLEMS